MRFFHRLSTVSETKCRCVLAFFLPANYFLLHGTFFSRGSQSNAMGWDDIVNQERVCAALRRTVEQGRVAHAYLFHGPDGVGKRAVALAFAQTLECERAADGTACGRCLACTKVRRMLHPDLHVLFPHPKGTDEEDLAERLKRLGQDPYATIDFVRRPSLSDPAETSNKQAFYPVDRIHEDLLRPMSFRPLEGRYKIAVVTDADLMRTEAANAFLKLLEEPPPQTVFVLTTARPERLLPTITSRCQRLRFDPLTPEVIEAALRAREAAAPDRAAMLARMADGSFSRALDLTENEELLAGRRLVLDYLRLAYTQDAGRLPDLVEEIGRLGRERVKGLLRLMLRWLRDLVLYRAIGSDAPLVNVDQAEAARRFCENVPEADLDAMIDLTEEAVQMAGRNVHLGLLLTALAQALGRAMRGRHDGRLYVALPDAQFA